MLEGSTIRLSNGKRIKITPLDAVRLYLDTSNIAFLKSEMDDDDEHIISIGFEDKFTIKKGDKIPLHIGNVKTVYEIEYVIIEKKGRD